MATLPIRAGILWSLSYQISPVWRICVGVGVGVGDSVGVAVGPGVGEAVGGAGVLSGVFAVAVAAVAAGAVLFRPQAAKAALNMISMKRNAQNFLCMATPRICDVSTPLDILTFPQPLHFPRFCTLPSGFLCFCLPLWAARARFLGDASSNPLQVQCAPCRRNLPPPRCCKGVL